MSSTWLMCFGDGGCKNTFPHSNTSPKKWSHISRNFAVGNVVLMLDENAPRSSWPLGYILEVFPNKSDGLVRSV